MIERGRSLYSRIILVIAAIFGIGTIALGAAAWFYARIAADDAYDRLLVGAALQIAESIYAQDGIVSVDPPISAFETLSLSSRESADLVSRYFSRSKCWSCRPWCSSCE